MRQPVFFLACPLQRVTTITTAIATPTLQPLLQSLQTSSASTINRNRAPSYPSTAAPHRIIHNRSLHRIHASGLSAAAAPLPIRAEPPRTKMPPKVNLEPLLSRHNNPKDIAEIERKVFEILQPAVSSPKSSKAADVAADIDELYASGYTGDRAEDFLYTLWNFYIEAAKEVPVGSGDAALGLLADVVAELGAIEREEVEIWGSKSSVWKNLPMLGPCMRDAWNFEPKFDESKEDDKKVSQWISLNSIAARLLGAGTQSWTNFAIWSLRETLEIPSSNEAARDAGLGVAAQWLAHAGKKLRAETAEARELSEQDKRSLAPGKLFSEGQSGLSEERWTFWRNRIEELSEEAGQSGKTAAETAINALDSL